MLLLLGEVGIWMKGKKTREPFLVWVVFLVSVFSVRVVAHNISIYVTGSGVSLWVCLS